MYFGRRGMGETFDDSVDYGSLVVAPVTHDPTFEESLAAGASSIKLDFTRGFETTVPGGILKPIYEAATGWSTFGIDGGAKSGISQTMLLALGAGVLLLVAVAKGRRR